MHDNEYWPNHRNEKKLGGLIVAIEPCQSALPAEHVNATATPLAHQDSR